ncbi:hypothetical protein OHB12_11905 [Nocardia sp. NBC_01730]|uniref:IucA/IucC family protein n=1 Tax=Nocardia sp. NBC_01730 TaxID=2975998 RepID=UPI002E145E77|nr:hypothetical protein OHB12_11905 [Nocardia sp. NBC_01730]
MSSLNTAEPTESLDAATVQPTAAESPGLHPQTADRLPVPDDVVAHTLLNCLLREVSGPEHQATVTDDHIILRLPRRGVLLRAQLRRTSLFGAHRFRGPVRELRAGGWATVSWRELASHIRDELSLRTGVANDEFLDQVANSHETVTAAVNYHREGPTDIDYLTSEQSLLFGHRFHPTPKSRSGEQESWTRYAPEFGAVFGLRLLAVRSHLIAEESADTAALTAIDNLHADLPAGFRLLPVHPWQYELLRDNTALYTALERGDIVDLGTGDRAFAATASVRTLYDGETFLKFSLNVRITNCLRKNATYELSGAVALTRILHPVFDDLAQRFPAAVILREPAYRSLALPGADGTADRALLEGFGVIVREGLARRLRPGVTALLTAAVADEYPTSSAHISQLIRGHNSDDVLRWWTAYLDLAVPPVLAAYFDHGVVLEPHLQNVVIGVDTSGLPVQVLFRDLEGTKLLPERHAAALAGLLPEVADRMSYDAQQGWSRVVYCLLVNNVAETLAVLADLRPDLERDLWHRVYTTLRRYADENSCPPSLSALLAGVPLPAKANLLTRWERKADRDAGYVQIPSPFVSADQVPAQTNTTETVGGR